jgi:hypothetical protein
MRARGLARAREFGWDRCAAETFRLYEEVLGVRTATAVYQGLAT